MPTPLLGVMMHPRLADAYSISSRVLGEGSFGKVHAGSELATGRTVAIKLCKYQSPEHLTDYTREADNLKAASEHPNIVRLLASAVDLSTCTGTMVFELCTMDLRQMLWRYNEMLPCPVVGQLRVHMFSAAAFLHSRSIIHRDIKPGNLLVDATSPAGPCLKLSDLGSSRRVRNALRSTAMTPGVTTPWYCAPESCRHQAPRAWTTGRAKEGSLRGEACTGERERKVTGMQGRER